MNEEYRLTPYETREILFYKTDNNEVRAEILIYQEIRYKHQRLKYEGDFTLHTNSIYT